MNRPASQKRTGAAQRQRALLRWHLRRAERRGYAIDPEAMALREGLAGGVAVTLLTALAMVLHRPEVTWAPYAAFWTCLADPRALVAERLWVMACFVISGALAAGGMSLLAGCGWTPTELVLAVLVGCCLFVGLRLPGMENVGVLVGVVAVVAAEQPVGITHAPLVALTFFAGGALSLLLCFAVAANWLPDRRKARSRHAPVPVHPALRHAVLTAGGVLATYAAAHAFALPYPQWATIAAVVVARPDLHASRRRIIERIAGSIVGGLAATLITLAVTAPEALLVPIFALAVGAITTRSVNYTLFVCFLTPLFVIAGTAMASAPPLEAAASRAADNALGSILTLLACTILWGAGRMAALGRT